MGKATTIKSFISGTVTSSGQTSGFDLSNYLEMLALFNYTAGSGTISVNYEVSDDNTTYYKHTVNAMAAVSTTGTQSASLLTNIGKWGRFAYIITGTSPSIGFTIKSIVKT